MSALDLIARNRIALVEADAQQMRTLEALRDGLARSRGKVPGLAASPPTTSIFPTTDQTDLPAPYTHYQPVDDAGVLRSEWFSFRAGKWIEGGLADYARCFAPFGGDGTSGGVLLNYSSVNGGVVEFLSSAPDLVLCWHNYAANGGGFRLLIDDEFVKAGKYGCDGNPARANLRVKHGDGSVTYRKMRKYTLIGGNDFRFGGVKVSPLYRPAPVPARGGLKILLEGDSFVQGDSSAVTAALYPTMGSSIALALGQTDCWAMGIGSTGFLTTGVGRSTIVQRAAVNIVANAPRVVIELGGYNDAALVSAAGNTVAFETSIETWLSTIKTGLPDTVVFMTGPMSNGGGNATLIAMAAAKKAVAARWAGRGVYYIENYGAAEWVHGTGYPNSPTATGNADWVNGGTNGADTVHPSPEGAAYLAQRIASGIAQVI